MPPAKVLVVDDDPDIIAVLRIILESADYEVAEAFSPREAHERLLADDPDLILLDVMMPNEAEGLVFLHQLRDEYPSPFAEKPVIIVSSVYDVPRVRLGMRLPEQPERAADELPVQGFLRKPPEPSALLSMVAKILRPE